MTDKILPCPFCGGESRTIKGARINTRGNSVRFWRVFCIKCQSRQLFHRTENEAINAWNLRA